MLRFDLDNIHVKNNLKSVMLGIYIKEVRKGPGAIHLHALKKEIGPGANWVWSSTGYGWTTQGGDYETVSIDSVQLEYNDSDTGWKYLKLPLDIISKTSPNNGFMIKGKSVELYVDIFSSNNNNLALRPKLILEYDIETKVTKHIMPHNELCLRKISNKKLLIFNPNLASGMLKIIGANGKIIFEKNIASKEYKIDISDIQSKGIYFIVLKSYKETFLTKLFIGD